MRKPRNGNGHGKSDPNYKPPKEKCKGCRNFVFVYKRIDNQAYCRKCSELPMHKCDGCHEIRIINFRDNSTGKAFCIDCYEPIPDICTECNKKGVIAVRRNGQVICRSCYVPPKQKCSDCGKPRALAQKDPPLCHTCYGRYYQREKAKRRRGGYNEKSKYAGC